MSLYPPPQQTPQPPRPPMAQLAAPNVRPYLTYLLLGLTVSVYLLQLAGEYLLGADVVTYLGIKYNPLIRQGELWRLVTPVFLHGSFVHIGFNMYALFLYGRELEARFGHGRFALLYFLSAFAGNVFSFILTPAPSLGASTAIFGLIAAETVFVLQNRQILANSGRRLTNLLYIVGINLLLGFTSTGIDNYGHLGGLLGGLAFTWFGGPRWKVEGVYPYFKLVDEREGEGAITGTAVVLLIFIPLAAIGWIWPK